MPPRKNHPLDTSERQARLREQRAEAGMVRKEFWLSRQAVEDLELINRTDGPEQARTYVEWALAEGRKRIEKAGR